MDRIIWIFIVIIAATLASLLGSFLAWLIKGNKKKTGKKGMMGRGGDDDETSRASKPKPMSPMATGIFAGCGCLILGSIFSVSVIMLIIQNMPGPGPGPGGDKGGDRPPPKIENPVEPIAEDLGPKEKQTQIMGGGGGATFKDGAPPNGYLIGFDAGLGKFFDLDLVMAIQPRYMTPKGEVLGRKFGTDFGNVVPVKAKPGYAVGAIDVKAGLLVKGFSVKFMRIKEGGLDPKDSYSSPWIGDKTGGGGPTLLTGNGTTIVGVIGRHNARELTGIGLLKR